MFNDVILESKDTHLRDEIVFIRGNKEYVFYLNKNKVTLKEFKPPYYSIVINKKMYHGDDYDAGKIGYKKYEINKNISINGDHLFYKRRIVKLPSNIQIRVLWNQAILWNKKVIILGRTSKTDSTANLIPPFYATELIYFDEKDLIANVVWVDFKPPDDYSGMLVLQPLTEKKVR